MQTSFDEFTFIFFFIYSLQDVVSSTNVEIKTEIKEEAKEDTDEPDFIETNCHWGECTIQFNTQAELVSKY